MVAVASCPGTGGEGGDERSKRRTRRQNECQSAPSPSFGRVFADDEGMTDQSTLGSTEWNVFIRKRRKPLSLSLSSPLPPHPPRVTDPLALSKKPFQDIIVSSGSVLFEFLIDSARFCAKA